MSLSDVLIDGNVSLDDFNEFCHKNYSPEITLGCIRLTEEQLTPLVRKKLWLLANNFYRISLYDNYLYFFSNLSEPLQKKFLHKYSSKLNSLLASHDRFVCKKD